MPSPAPSPSSSGGRSSYETGLTTQKRHLKILLWNLWLLPSLLTDRRANSRALAISPLLNAYDIVVLNEAFTNKKALLSQTTHPHRYIPACPRGRLFSSGLIFLSRHEIVEQGWEQYERKAGIDKFAGKGIGFVTVRVEGMGLMQVFGTHMQAGAKGVINARSAQAAQASRYIVDHMSTEEEAVVILTGDLNMGPRLDETCEEYSVHYADSDDARARCKAYEDLVQKAGLDEIGCEQAWEYQRDICRFLIGGPGQGKVKAWARYEDLSAPDSQRLSDTKPISLTFTLGETQGEEKHR